MLDLNIVLKRHIVFVWVICINLVNSSIDGLTYMDPINRRPLPNQYERGEDPCNPLYWYPRNIPEYCNYRNFSVPVPPAPPLTIPIPVPIPQPPVPIPIPQLSMPVPISQPNFIPVPMPAPLPMAPWPYGSPVLPSNPILPVPQFAPSYPQNIYQYGTNPQQAGMIPGLPGIVSNDGGINILPFSDAYSDLLEKHKNKMIRRRLKKLIQHYKTFPNGRSHRHLRKYADRIMEK